MCTVAYVLLNCAYMAPKTTPHFHNDWLLVNTSSWSGKWEIWSKYLWLLNDTVTLLWLRNSWYCRCVYSVFWREEISVLVVCRLKCLWPGSDFVWLSIKVIPDCSDMWLLITDHCYIYSLLACENGLIPWKNASIWLCTVVIEQCKETWSHTVPSTF